MNRRFFLTGLAAGITAPLIVPRVALMGMPRAPLLRWIVTINTPVLKIIHIDSVKYRETIERFVHDLERQMYPEETL